MILKQCIGSLFAILFLIHGGCKGPNRIEVKNPFHDSIIREIHIQKDLRKAGAIVPHLQSRSELRRYHAALALISVADSAAVPYLDRALNDRSERVRQTAAVALAQTGSRAAEKALLRAVKDEMTPEGRIHILEQLGACASESGRVFLMQLHAKDSATGLGLCKGLYRYVLKNGASDGIQDRLFELIADHPQAECVRFASLALSRSKEPLPIALEPKLLEYYRRFEGSETRKALISCLAKVPEISDTNQFVDLFPLTGPQPLQLSWLAWAKAHPGIAGVNQKIIDLWYVNTPWNLQYALYQASKSGYALAPDSIMAQYEFPWKLLKEMNVPKLREFILDKRNDPYTQAFCLLELGALPALNDLYLNVFRSDNKALILRNAALEQALSLELNRFILHKEALLSKEGSFVSLACLSLLDLNIPQKELPWLKEIHRILLGGFNVPSGWETYLDLKKLGVKINGGNYVQERAPLAGKFGHRELELLKPSYMLEMNTSKGIMRFELTSTLAPFSVLNVLEAVRNSYYNEKMIHRVVPGFVAQGGCYRGDGWGSPDWLQRSELSFEAFEAGAVGIASAGKDTEGLQLFWMHAHAPHLEGRYSRIGALSEGMNVLLSLQPGDVIHGMKIVNP